MQPTTKAVGFCPMCMQNVEHTRKFSWFGLALLDQLTCRVASLFRLGPWYCFQCERKTFYLPPVNRHAPTFNTDQARSSFLSDPDLATEDEETLTAVRNYLKADHSLVMREKKASRFSRKFRDAAVMRLLSGTHSLSQISRELAVSESDIIAWCAQMMRQRDERISELQQQLDALIARGNSTLKKLSLEPLAESRNQTNLSELDCKQMDVIEGKVLPK